MDIATHMLLRQISTIKSHDRGKLGYFGNHKVISYHSQLTIIPFVQPINVSRRRARHEGKPKSRLHLFSDISEKRKQIPPRLAFAFMRCPATGNIERLAKCYYRVIGIAFCSHFVNLKSLVIFQNRRVPSLHPFKTFQF